MKETVDFLTKLECFFLYDDQSRWRAIAWIIAVAGSLGTLDLVFLGASVDDTVFLMGTIILLMSITWIGWYCSFRRTRITEFYFLSRRELIFQGASFLVFVLALRLPHLEAQALERNLKRISINPKPEDVDKVTNILESSRAARVTASPVTVKALGNKLIEQGPAAWKATLALLNYRSFLNIGAVPKVGNQAPIAPLYATSYDVPKTLGPMWAQGKSIAPDVPQFHPLSEVDPNVFSPSGPSFLRIVGGWMTLDGYAIKRVILENVEIHYEGGPMSLENVFLVNCTFNFQPQPHGIEFAKAILDSPQVNFSTISKTTHS